MGHRHLMIDIETLGRRPGGVIWEVGAVVFDLESGMEGAYFDRRIDVADAVAEGLEIEPETALWWQERGDVRRHGADTLRRVLSEFVEFVNDADTEAVWSWGMDFDFPILTHALNLVEMGPPWNYWEKRDARTVWHLAYGDARRPSRGHVAVDDCRAAVEDLRDALRDFKGGGDE